MCGIYGIWHRDGQPVNLTALETATNRLRHRGPDDEGYLLINPTSGLCISYAGAETDPRLALPPLAHARGKGDSLAFGFRRLAIVDLSPTGHQPMSSADGRFWIIFNGEIYNYIELRTELQHFGHRFHSETDTEVILAAYAQWNISCLDRLNGMWAFAIWDCERRTLFLARDRFGIKPLYYAVTDHTFAFASEIKALIGSHAASFHPEPIAVYRFLVYGLLPSPQGGSTFFSGVKALPPGHYMLISMDSPPILRRYYDLPLPSNDQQQHTINDILTTYRNLFIDAVRLELRSDVAVGTCLSGGVDSSSIVCVVNHLMRQNGLSTTQLGERPKTFSAVYADNGRYNERPHIDRVLRATDVDAHFIIPTATRLHTDLEHLTWYQEEPFQSTSIFAQWCVMSLARECGVKVLLDGQGADELLAGYRPYAQYLGDIVRSGQVANFIKESLLIQARTGQPMLLMLFKTLTLLRPEFEPKVNVWIRPRLQPPVLQADFAHTCRRNGLEHLLPLWRGQGSLDHHLRDAIKESSLPHLLRYEDRNAMAFSVESRVPFLDHRLVSFIFQQAPHLRIRHGWTKWVHRQAMTGLLPDAVAWRSDKVGFETPEADWQRALLAARPDLFVDGAPCGCFLDLSQVRQAVKKWYTYGGDTRRIWRWISLAVWLQVWQKQN